MKIKTAHRTSIRFVVVTLIALSIATLMCRHPHAQAATTFTVNSVADTDDGACTVTKCTLRDAINAANATPGADTINFAVNGTINLTGPLADISDNVSIHGPGTSLLTVRRDAGGGYRIFHATMSATVNLSGLTITNGFLPDYSSSGAGILIDSGATLNISNCDITDNSVTTDLFGPTFSGRGGGIANLGGTVNIATSNITGNYASGNGGGIYNEGVLNIANSLVSNNRSTYGGGIGNEIGTITITNCTVAGNQADYIGGGLANGINTSASIMTINNSTIARNTSPNCGGVLSLFGTTTLRSSISGDNSSGDLNGGFNSDGFNLYGNGGATITINPGAGPDIVNEFAQFDPAGLQDNGGPTKTIKLLRTSPAIDRGKNFAVDANGNPIATDQRGFLRPVDDARPNATGGDGSDIGAYEVQSIDHAPVAKAKTSIEVPANLSCQAIISAQQVDDGSADPDGDPITLKLDSTGPFSLGEHTVTLTVTDDVEASSSTTSTVKVIDSTPPSLTVTGPNPFFIEVGTVQAYADPGATASDNCAGNLAGKIITTSNVDPVHLGSYRVDYSLSDGVNSVNASRVVIVRDTTPPVLSPVANIVVDAKDAEGTNVNYSLPTATDAGGAPTVGCLPGPGRFHVGVTLVACMATDPSHQSTTRQFTVTVLAPRPIDQDVLSKLMNLRATVADKKDLDKLDDAIKHLKNALGVELWLNDTYPQAKGGDKVFNETKDVVNKLGDLMKDKHSLLPDSVLQGFINRLVNAARVLTLVAISNVGGGDPKKLAKANDELLKGDAEMNSGKPADAVEHYRNAWTQALKL
jgi:CSLREA domain-containing protein